MTCHFFSWKKYESRINFSSCSQLFWCLKTCLSCVTHCVCLWSVNSFLPKPLSTLPQKSCSTVQGNMEIYSRRPVWIQNPIQYGDYISKRREFDFRGATTVEEVVKLLSWKHWDIIQDSGHKLAAHVLDSFDPRFVSQEKPIQDSGKNNPGFRTQSRRSCPWFFSTDPRFVSQEKQFLPFLRKEPSSITST